MASSPPAASCPSASRSTMTWYTSPTPALAAATTPASGSARHGRLAPIAGSTVALPDGSQPGDVLFNGTGTKLVGTRIGTSLIDSFTVGFDGRLTAAPGSPFTAQGLGPFGSEFRPTNPDQLFVSNAHNVGAGTGTISAFSDSRQRDAIVDRSLPVRRSPDGSVLGGDHPRRPVPVHREHRIRRNLPLLDRPRRRADAARQHPGRRHRRRRRGRRPAGPRRRASCGSTRAGSAPSARSPSTAAT